MFIGLGLLSVASAQPLVAVVVVDEAARETGYALEIDGWLVDDALPIDVAEGEVLKLVDPGGHTEILDLAAGEAWEVTGTSGEAWMSLLDDEIRTDLIAVKGSEESIKALARDLDAEVIEDDGVIYLAADEVLLESAWVEDELALQVDEVAFVPVRRRAEEPKPVAPVQLATAAKPAARPVATPVAEPAAPVQRPKKRARKLQRKEQRSAELNIAPAESVQFRTVGEEALEAYSGVHMCRNEVVVLQPDGSYGFRDVVGYWTVSSPGVVRLQSFEGEVFWRMGLDPDTGFCRDVWAPDDIVMDPMLTKKAAAQLRRLSK